MKEADSAWVGASCVLMNKSNVLVSVSGQTRLCLVIFFSPLSLIHHLV